LVALSRRSPVCFGLWPFATTQCNGDRPRTEDDDDVAGECI
jgi:hypothetical protein